MNIMRKLRNGTSSSNANAASTATATSQNAGEPNDNAQQNQLGLMHLKKLFTEYTNPKEPLSEAERDYKLYNMLPLFCKVIVFFSLYILLNKNNETVIILFNNDIIIVVRLMCTMNI